MKNVHKQYILVAVVTIVLLLPIHLHIVNNIKSDFHDGTHVYVKGITSDAKGEWSNDTMMPFDGKPPRVEGFPYSDGEKKWSLQVINNGTKPATNVKVRYEIIAYKNKIEFGEDRSIIEDYYPVVYKQVEQELLIDYIPPGESTEQVVFYMCTFPEAELSVLEVKSSEDVYLKDKIRISKYKHEEFDYLEDSPHLRMMLGLWDGNIDN